MIRFTHKGDFSKTLRFLNKAKTNTILSILHRYGQDGVRALAANTPIDTGNTASSWGYEVVHTSGRSKIYWTNSNVQNGSFNSYNSSVWSWYRNWWVCSRTGLYKSCNSSNF